MKAQGQRKEKDNMRRNSQTSTSKPIDNAVLLATEWEDANVLILGRGGRICVVKETGQVVTGYSGGSLDATRGKTIVDEFIIRASKQVYGAVSFQVSGTQMFLTVPLYGNQIRREVSTALEESLPILPLDIIPLIVEYTVGRSTDTNNFEGCGFNYSPMMALEEEKSAQQQRLFTLCCGSREICSQKNKKFGVQSLFGTYWRSQHWTRTVSQSSHLEVDETWTFQPVMVMSSFLDSDREEDW